jgi:hypothetical protein
MRTLSGRFALLAACVVAALAASATPAAAAGKVAAKPRFTYGCFQALAVCRQAGTLAGDSKASVERYLADAARRSPVTAAGAGVQVSGYGFTLIDGGGILGRYYGWRLSMNEDGIPLNYYRCVVQNGIPVSCNFEGVLRIQARYTFNGRQVRGMYSQMRNFTPHNLGVRFGVVCRRAGVGVCATEVPLAQPNMQPNGGRPERLDFVSHYLDNGGVYDEVFIWEVYDSEIDSTATTPAYNSLAFECEPYGTAQDPGQCFYPGYLQGILQ